MRELERGNRSDNDRLAESEIFRRGHEPARGRESRAFASQVRESQRFWDRVDRVGGLVACWSWLGATSRGYGRFQVKRDGKWVLLRAHRWAYEQAYGPIPHGLYLDHLCHTNDPTCLGGDTCPHRRCTNPTHLELVTDGENRRRGRDRKVQR